MADQEEFQSPDGFDMAEITELRDAALQVAGLLADHLRDAGFTTRQGASMAAHIMLDAAYAIAVCGALAENKEPQPKRFIEAAQCAIDRLDMEATKARFADLADEDEAGHQSDAREDGVV